MPPRTRQSQEVNNVWASNAPSTMGELRTLPSGQTCRARRVQIEDLVSLGILEQADSLTSLVDTKHVRKVRGGKGPDRDEINLESVLKDSKALHTMIGLADKAMPVVVLDPPVALHYRTNDDGSTAMLGEIERRRMREERPGLVFTDQIDLFDKMELLNWAMGSMGGLESFRDEQPRNAVDTVDDGAGVPRPTKRIARARTR